MQRQGQTRTPDRSAPDTLPRGRARLRPGVRDAVIPIHPFTGLLSLAIESGWSARELFRGFEFDRIGRPLPGQHVSYLQAREIILRMERRIGPQAAALSGARKSVPNLGVLGLGVIAQSRFGDALQFGIDFQRLSGAMLDVMLEVDGDEAALVVADLFGDDEIHGFLRADHLLCAINSLLLLPGDEFALRRVELEGEPAPELVERLGREFKCPVQIHAEVSRAVFDARHLASALRFGDPVTVELSRHACERELNALGLTAPARQARDYLLADDGSVRTPAQMAAEIGVCTRTVHRMLAADGLKYTGLVEQARVEQACRLLVRGLTTDDVAQALNYSDSRSFRRAFERWTGETPAQFRQRR